MPHAPKPPRMSNILNVFWLRTAVVTVTLTPGTNQHPALIPWTQVVSSPQDRLSSPTSPDPTCSLCHQVGNDSRVKAHGHSVHHRKMCTWQMQTSHYTDPRCHIATSEHLLCTAVILSSKSRGLSTACSAIQGALFSALGPCGGPHSLLLTGLTV